MPDDELVAALDTLRAAAALRTVLPRGSRDRQAIEALIDTLEHDIRRHIDSPDDAPADTQLTASTDAAARYVAATVP